tara:strand:- start:537 stop:824 length:288 start_codon:yes stop_codon:yes gene_type:complete
MKRMKMSKMENTKNLSITNELIGQNVRVSSNHNENINGLNGIVIYETKNLLHLQCQTRILKIPKNTAFFKFSFLEDRIDGKYLIGRTEDRISKLR